MSERRGAFNVLHHFLCELSQNCSGRERGGISWARTLIKHFLLVFSGVKNQMVDEKIYI